MFDIKDFFVPDLYADGTDSVPVADLLSPYKKTVLCLYAANLEQASRLYFYGRYIDDQQVSVRYYSQRAAGDQPTDQFPAQVDKTLVDKELQQLMVVGRDVYAAQKIRPPSAVFVVGDVKHDLIKVSPCWLIDDTFSVDDDNVMHRWLHEFIQTGRVFPELDSVNGDSVMQVLASNFSPGLIQEGGATYDRTAGR